MPTNRLSDSVVRQLNFRLARSYELPALARMELENYVRERNNCTLGGF
jgi:hypothetical protein